MGTGCGALEGLTSKVSPFGAHSCRPNSDERELNQASRNSLLRCNSNTCPTLAGSDCFMWRVQSTKAVFVLVIFCA